MLGFTTPSFYVTRDTTCSLVDQRTSYAEHGPSAVKPGTARNRIARRSPGALELQVDEEPVANRRGWTLLRTQELVIQWLRSVGL